MQPVNITKISDYIERNDIIEVKISPDSEWIINCVSGINDSEDILEICLLDAFLNMNLMIHDEIHCKFIRDSYVYIFNGIVLDIGIMDSKKVVIKIDNVEKYNNERQARRYTVNLCGNIVYDNHEKSGYSTIKDLSESGLSLVTKEHIQLHEEVDVSIVLWKDKVLSVEGKVMRIFKMGHIYKYGIVFEDIDFRSKELLCEFIDEMRNLEINKIFE